MTNLIDGVIEAGSEVGRQCLQFVNDITHGAGAGFYDAASLASTAQARGILHSTPQLGDVAVWNAGVGGAGSHGHAALVTNVSGGQVAVTGTNWPGGSGAEQTVIGANNIGMGSPSGYINPSAIGGQNIITGHFDPFGQAPLSTTTPNVETSSGVGSLWSRLGWSAAGLGLIVLGLVLVFRRDVQKAVTVVGRAVPG